MFLAHLLRHAGALERASVAIMHQLQHTARMIHEDLVRGGSNLMLNGDLLDAIETRPCLSPATRQTRRMMGWTAIIRLFRGKRTAIAR